MGQSPEPLSYTKTAKLVDEEARSEHLKTTRNTTVVLYGGQREIKSGARETPVDAPGRPSALVFLFVYISKHPSFICHF